MDGLIIIMARTVPEAATQRRLRHRRHLVRSLIMSAESARCHHHHRLSRPKWPCLDRRTTAGRLLGRARQFRHARFCDDRRVPTRPLLNQGPCRRQTSAGGPRTTATKLRFRDGVARRRCRCCNPRPSRTTTPIRRRRKAMVRSGWLDRRRRRCGTGHGRAIFVWRHRLQIDQFCRR